MTDMVSVHCGCTIHRMCVYDTAVYDGQIVNTVHIKMKPHRLRLHSPSLRKYCSDIISCSAQCRVINKAHVQYQRERTLNPIMH